MCRYIVLFLITGSVWAKTGLDKLVLKDGPKYIGKYLNTEGMIEKQNQNTIASLDLEYENLNIHERAIYDAKKDAKKWLLFVPIAGSTVAFLSWKYADITGDHPLESITASIIPVFGLFGSYFFFRQLDTKNVENWRKDEYYQLTYSKEYKKQIFKSVKKSFLATGIAGALGAFLLMQSVSSGLGGGPPIPLP